MKSDCRNRLVLDVETLRELTPGEATLLNGGAGLRGSGDTVTRTLAVLNSSRCNSMLCRPGAR